MFKMQRVKTLVEERLTAAVEDILGIIENVLKDHVEKDSGSKSEDERRRHNRLDVLLKPTTIKHRTDPPQLSVYKEEVPPEQQEWSPSLDQEEPEPLQIKEEEEEEEELWTSQEEEQLRGLEETDTKDSIFTIICVKDLREQHLSQTVEHREGGPLPSTSTEQRETDAHGEDCGASEPTEDWQTLSSDPSVAESEDTDGDEEGGGPQSGLKTKASQSSESGTSMESSHLKSANQDASTCKVCWKSFTYHASFMKHVKTHAKDVPCVCGVCGKHVESTESLMDHLNSHKTKRHICSICHKGFCSSSHKAGHMRLHAGQKPHGCIVCGKIFTSDSLLSVHMRIHTGSKPYSCSLCTNHFRFISSLRAHMKTHTGERPYSCSVCGKGFSRSSDLKEHMMTHTGEKPYSCSSCGRRFRRHQHIQRHMKIHTGEKPYSCSVCGKGFSRRDSAQDHIKTHTGEKP